MNDTSKETVELDYDEITARTKVAVLIDFGWTLVWLPDSLIELDEQEKTVSMSERLATEKGLV